MKKEQYSKKRGTVIKVLAIVLLTVLLAAGWSRGLQLRVFFWLMKERHTCMCRASAGLQIGEDREIGLCNTVKDTELL